MTYSLFELIWLFFIYSFIGWIIETVITAIRHKQFVNKGVVNLPLNLLSGAITVFITVFAYELHGGWLFLYALVISGVFMWITGHLIEKIFHEKWWDYSDERWNFDGYISVTASILYGIGAVIIMSFGNSLCMTIYHLIPWILRMILLGILIIGLILDIVATLWILSEGAKNTKRWEAIDQHIDQYTDRLVAYIYAKVDRRIHRAYPNAKKVEVSEKSKDIFAYGCSFYKIVWLFGIGAFLGDIVETLYCRVTAGVWMSRSSLVWGAFSLVWGFALAAATILLYKYRDKEDHKLFLAGTFLGGVYEYACSVFTEIFFGKVFWDYSHMPFNLGGRINLLYCFFWGIAAIVWIKGIYPKMSDWIERIPMRPGKVLTWIFVGFMICNMAVSSMALARSTQRQQGIPATKSWQEAMDTHFDDERIQRIYPNAQSTN